jgi:hypothetical protein
MMLKCASCGAAWTSLGMTLCPMCGAKVEPPPGISESGRHERIPAPKPPVPEPPKPILSAVLPLPPPPPPEPPAPPPPKAAHAAPALSDFGFDRITIGPESAVESKPMEQPSVAPPEADSGILQEDDSWYCSLPVVAPPPKRAKPALRKHAPIKVRPPSAASTAITELMDASVLVDRVRPAPRPTPKPLPAPARPPTVPLVLGVVAALSGLLLPLTAALERHRIVGVLGIVVCALLLPLAPLAWIAGLAAERRRREQGLRAERRVVVGRLLGQWGTLVLAAEGTIALLSVAALRLVGKIPIPFWAP